MRRMRPRRGAFGWKILLWRKEPRRVGRLDLLIYRLFYWRWKPLLEDDPKLLILFKDWIDGWAEQEKRRRAVVNANSGG